MRIDDLSFSDSHTSGARSTDVVSASTSSASTSTPAGIVQGHRRSARNVGKVVSYAGLEANEDEEETSECEFRAPLGIAQHDEDDTVYKWTDAISRLRMPRL